MIQILFILIFILPSLVIHIDAYLYSYHGFRF